MGRDAGEIGKEATHDCSRERAARGTAFASEDQTTRRTGFTYPHGMLPDDEEIVELRAQPDAAPVVSRRDTEHDAARAVTEDE